MPHSQSAIRSLVLERDDLAPSLSTGHSAFRFMLSKQTVQQDSVLSSVINDEFRMLSWAGKDKRVMVYPVDFDKELNMTCTHPAHLSAQETAGGDTETAIGLSHCAFGRTMY